MIDAVVVGGGPVGLHAARRLASEGFDVEVLEEHPGPGQPVHCTGILAPEVFDEFSVPRTSVLNPLRSVTFHAPGGQIVRYPTERVQAVVIDRQAFDRSIAELASRAGARVHCDARVTHVVREDAGVTVHRADGRRHRARCCVLATGAGYALHRQLGLAVPPMALGTAQVELPAPGIGDVEVHVGTQLAPGGFAWAVPVLRPTGLHARIGIMSGGNPVRHFAGFLAGAERWGVEIPVRVQPRTRMLPLSPLPRTFGDRILVAGDAAGIVKPTTGGGLYYGIVSADIAAGVLTDALRRDDLDAGGLAVYQRRWRARLGDEIDAQARLRTLMQRLTDEEVGSIFDLWAHNGLMPLIRTTVTFNEHRRLVRALLRYPAMKRILFRELVA